MRVDPPAEPNTARSRPHSPVRLVVRPPSAARVSRLARLFGLMEHGEYLLAGRAAAALNAGAWAILAVAGFELFAWFLAWNAMLAGQALRLTYLSAVAALLATVTAGLVALVDRAIITAETHITFERGLRPAARNALYTAFLLVPRFGIIAAAVFFTGPPLHDLAFDQRIAARAAEEALLEEANRRVVDLLEARSEVDAAQGASVAERVGDTRQAREHDEAVAARKAFLDDVDAGRAKLEAAAAHVAQAKAKVRQVREAAGTADDKATKANRLASWARARAQRLPPTAPEAKRRALERNARAHERKARDAEALARRTRDDVRRAEAVLRDAEDAHTAADATQTSLLASLQRADADLGRTDQRLGAIEASASTQRAAETAQAEAELDRLRRWLEQVQSAAPGDVVVEHGDHAEAYRFAPPAPDPIDRERILADLRSGEPPAVFMAPDVRFVLAREAPFVLPATDAESLHRRRQVAEHIQTAYVRTFLLLALIPALAALAKLFYFASLGRYYSTAMQVAAGNPHALEVLQAEEAARRDARSRRGDLPPGPPPAFEAELGG